MKLTSSNLMTGGAIAFAAFALWFVTRGPGKAAAASPTAQAGELQRQAGGLLFFDLLNRQDREITQAAGLQLPGTFGAGAYSGGFKL